MFPRGIPRSGIAGVQILDITKSLISVLLLVYIFSGNVLAFLLLCIFVIIGLKFLDDLVDMMECHCGFSVCFSDY